tara:strand:+ start:174 stop:392 length:219 start_codon:yes stop_codon:yes gene_type:complete
MAINTFEVSGQLGKILGLSNVGVEWIERLEKLDQDTEIKYIKITLDSLKENLIEIYKETEKIDLYGDQEEKI